MVEEMNPSERSGSTDMEEETNISENREISLQMTQLTQTEMEEEIPTENRENTLQMTQLTQMEMEEEIPSENIGSTLQMTRLTSTEIEDTYIDVNREEPEPSNTRILEDTYIGVNREEPEPSNTPCLDLLHGSREDYVRYCVPLFRATITGNWVAAERIIRERPELVGYAITGDYNTPLHVAASVRTTKLMEDFVANLVSIMNQKDLLLQNRNSNTALWLAAAAGNVEIARIMLSRDARLLNICGNKGTFPLYAAAVYEREYMVKYLYDNHRGFLENAWTPTQYGLLLQKCVECDIFDVALRLLDDHPFLKSDESMLRILARKPDALYTVKKSFIQRIIHRDGPDENDSDALSLLKIVWETIIWEKIKPEVDHILRGPPDDAALNDQTSLYSSRILFVAAEAGNTQFLVELLQAYPDLAWEKNDDNLSIFHIAIMHRHQGIFNLLYEIGSLKDQIIHLKDKDDNNMLHLVGKTSKEMRPHMAEASLVMQRELLWFKAVEKQLPPIWRKRRNKAGQTPYELFNENNKDVVSEGLKWMKHCMVAATLIVTVAFAVAFTVPGGYSQDYGRPYFLYRSTFTVFVIADSICLVSSSASLLMFLSILTSRYNQDHFLYSLPKKLMVALFSLFISVVAMMVTFSASFFVLYHNGLRWVAFFISGFVAIPVVIFAMLQIPVLVDIYRSVYDNRYLFNPRSSTLYFAKPEHIVLRGPGLNFIQRYLH